jgi:hypothetical protein
MSDRSAPRSAPSMDSSLLTALRHNGVALSRRRDPGPSTTSKLHAESQLSNVSILGLLQECLPQHGAKISVPRFVLTVEPSDAGVLFACAETHCTIVVFGNARVAVIENRTGEVWMITTVDGGC